MPGRKNPFRNIKLVVRPSSPLLKITVIAVILCSMMALAALSWVRISIQNQTQAMLDQAAELEYENQELNQRIRGIGSVESIQQIALEELGLADPNAVIMNPNSQ